MAFPEGQGNDLLMAMEGIGLLEDRGRGERAPRASDLADGHLVDAAEKVGGIIGAAMQGNGANDTIQCRHDHVP